MDDLTNIKGIGKATAATLAAAGIDSFAKLAALQPSDDTLLRLAKSSHAAEAWIAAASELARENSGPAPGPSAVLPDTSAEDEFGELAARFPLTAAALEAWRATHDSPPQALRIASKVEGFRRADLAHGTAAVDHPLGDFRLPEQVEALFAEPMLIVELV